MWARCSSLSEAATWSHACLSTKEHQPVADAIACRTASSVRCRSNRWMSLRTRQDGGVQSFPLPGNLVDAVESEEHGRRRSWIGSLSGIVNRLEQQWSLKVGEPFQPGGQTAWVAPARSEAGSDLVLK